MREIGHVVEVTGQYVLVEVRRKSACEGCHKGAEGCDACSLFIADAKHRVSASNQAGAKVGDRVLLEAESGRILSYAFLVFIVPLVIACLFYAIADLAFHPKNELWSIGAAAIGLVLTYIIIGRITSHFEKKKRTVTVTRIFTDNELQEEMQESEED